MTAVVTSSGVLVVRCIECKTVGWAKLGVFVLKYGNIKVDKNEAFQRCHLNIFQNIDSMNDSVGFLKRINGGWYIVSHSSCVSC